MTTKETTRSHGIQIEQMDLSVDPGTDFNLYCNGTWLKNTEIPAAYPRWGMFMKLRDEALTYLVGLFQRLSTTASEPGSNAQKIGDLYFSGMNEDAIEAEDSRLSNPISRVSLACATCMT